jgi:hypothetical protein
MRQRLLLVFMASALAGFAAHRAIPYARACMAPLDTGASFDLTAAQLSETTSTGASVEEELATWPETGTLSLSDHRIDFADGTHLEFE